MKKAFLFSLLAILFLSCSAQRVEQISVYKVNAWVHSVNENITTLQPNDSRYSFQVASDSSLVKDKEYVFWLEITDCHECRTRQAVIVDKAFTTAQPQRDQNSIAKKLEHRTIIPYKF